MWIKQTKGAKQIQIQSPNPPAEKQKRQNYNNKMEGDDPLETDQFRDVLAFQAQTKESETPYTQAFYTPSKEQAPGGETQQPGPENPMTRITRATKRKETPGPSTAGVQTDPHRSAQTDPIMPLRAGAVKRRKLEDSVTKANLDDVVTRLTNTIVSEIGKLSKKFDDVRVLIESQGTRIGVVETRVRALQEARREETASAIRAPLHTTTPHEPVKPRDGGQGTAGLF